MKKKEIDAKFDEIVDYSEIGDFIDTPVKRYSSGMRVRLAFSVAAHLEQEIMLIDEVLAVGDTEFQKKCIGKMQHVAKDGKTVIFVSHNMAAVQSLCTRGIIIDKGSVRFDGPCDEAISTYFSSLHSGIDQDLELRTDRIGGKNFRFTSVEFLDPVNRKPCNFFVSGQSILIKIGYKAEKTLKGVGIAISITTLSREHLITCTNQAVGVSLDIEKGSHFTYCMIEKLPLKIGRYAYHLYSHKGKNNILDWIQDAGTLDIHEGNFYGHGDQPAPGLSGVLIDYSWQHHESIWHPN